MWPWRVMVSLQKGQVRTAPSTNSVTKYSFFRPQTGQEKGSFFSIWPASPRKPRPVGGELHISALCPNARDRFSAVSALSILQVDLSNHIACPLNDHFLTFWAEGVFARVAWNVPDVNILKACR